MWDRSILVFGIILDMCLHSDAIYTAELTTSAALASYVSCVIMFFAIHQIMAPDLQPCHHMYHSPSSSSPSLRTWAQHNRDTLAGKSTHCKVKRINWVRGFWIDKYNHWWNTCGHTEEIRQSKNCRNKFAKELHIRQVDLIYISTIDSQNAPTSQQQSS